MQNKIPSLICLSDSLVNYLLKNQSTFSLVVQTPAKSKLTIIFEKKQRLFVQISKDNFDNDIVKFIKKFVVPNTPYLIMNKAKFMNHFVKD